MDLLLDIHAFLWAISDDPRLGSHNRDLITNQANGVLLSHVSLWEIGIKHTLTLERTPLHHRDPFDRLLLAQAISEPLTLITADGGFEAWECPLQDAHR